MMSHNRRQEVGYSTTLIGTVDGGIVLVSVYTKIIIIGYTKILFSR